jgi:hypothetical protein
MASLRPPRGLLGHTRASGETLGGNSLTFGLFADEEEADFAREVAATPPSTTSPTCSSWSLTAGRAWAIE